MDIQPTAAAKNKIVLIINCLILAIGVCGAPLIMRLYFIHGGNRIWFSSFLQTAGLPLILIPLAVSYTRRRGKNDDGVFLMRPRVFATSAAVGTLVGVDNYLYAYGVSRLPVSTSSLIIASQLVFTAVFAFFLVRQGFTSYSVNAVVLLTLAAAVLGLHTGGDRPEGETRRAYLAGFMMTMAAAALYGLILPLIELTYKKARQAITFTLVLEIQLVMCLFATAFCALGMIVNNDFQAIAREANAYGLGKATYYIIVALSAIMWQCYFLGSVGIIFCASSLLSGVLIAVLLPITEVLAVIFFHEKFKVEKGISLFLSIWGFTSYFYGDINRNNKSNKDTNTLGETELARQTTDINAP